MAAEPPKVVRNRSFSDLLPMNDFRSTPVNPLQLSTSFSSAEESRCRVLDNAPSHFSAMISEIERVRSRFTSEKSNSDQFSAQLRMLSQQIESLTSQQSSMLEFHIGRMDTMLKDLKASGDVAKQQQRVAFEAQQRAKFEEEQRDRIGREERKRREMMENLEREQRERQQREQNEREEKAKREEMEREYRIKMESLRQGSLSSMNLSDTIPQPSRTVTASKRKLSLDLGDSRSSQHVGTKRAKANATNSPQNNDGLFQQFMNSEDEKQPNRGSTGVANVATKPAADETSAPMEDDELPVHGAAGAFDEMSTTASSRLPTQSSDLPADIHEALKQQAMAMLQAQLDVTNTVVKPEPPTVPPQPCNTLAKSSTLSPSLVKSETPKAAVLVKSEPNSAVPLTKSAKKSKSGASKKPKKEVIPAVEDTTIADPMSVPLKNKAIHEWMSKDPERLYTADDICKAGIRYRARASIKNRQITGGNVYVLDMGDHTNVQKNVFGGRAKGFLWQKEGVNLWKVIIRDGNANDLFKSCQH